LGWVIKVAIAWMFKTFANNFIGTKNNCKFVRGHSIEKLPRWRDCTLPRWSMWKITILSTCNNIIHLPHDSQANSCPNLFPYVSLALLCESPEILFDIFNVYLNCFPKFHNISHEKQVPKTSNDVFLSNVRCSQLCHHYYA